MNSVWEGHARYRIAGQQRRHNDVLADVVRRRGIRVLNAGRGCRLIDEGHQGRRFSASDVLQAERS